MSIVRFYWGGSGDQNGRIWGEGKKANKGRASASHPSTPAGVAGPVGGEPKREDSGSGEEAEQREAPAG